MKILITGGNGFVAKNVAEVLGRKYRVVAAGRKELDLLDSERVEEYLKRGRFEAVIHTATYDAMAVGSGRDPEKVLEYNLRMFFNVARCRNDFGKMIYFGSGAEFGREHWKPKMEEEFFDSYVPSDQYGYSKYVMTKYAMCNEGIYNLRLFGNFGKYDDWKTRLIPNVCYRLIDDQTVEISQNKYYDFLFVEDLARIVEWFLRHNPKERIFNVCSGEKHSFKSVAELLVRYSGRRVKVLVSTPGLGGEYSGNNSRLIKTIGGFEFTPFSKALGVVYDWYEKNKKEVFRWT